MRPIDYFDRAVRRDPHAPFLMGDDLRYTFADADAAITATAKAMYANGFQPDDSVAVYSPNHPTAVIGVFAAMRAGGA